MTISLYAATIPSYLQVLHAEAALLVKAEAFCAEKNMAPIDLVQARLAPDMLPFAYQVKATVGHSSGAIEAVRKGVFAPNVAPPPGDFAALKSLVAEAIGSLEAVGEAELDTFVGRDMRFEFGERRMDFVAEEFLLTFSQPNFYFHAATAYDILRWKGMPIGKRDFIGKLRLKP